MTKNKNFECKFCKSNIQKWATICPVCKKDLRDWTKKHPIFTIILILFFIGIFVNNLLVNDIGTNSNNISVNDTNTSVNNNTSIDNTNNTIISWSCSSEMKETVANEYKSPSTVKFINCNWDKSKWIFWEADAQNWFWGVVRTSFLCNWDSCLITEK